MVGMYRDDMMAKIKIIDDFARKKTDSLYEAATKLTDFLKNQLIFLVSAILLLSVFINLFLIRNIRKPLLELTETTHKFDNGDLSARSKYESGNEFGTLSASFNSLAENIQIKTESDKKVAKLAEIMMGEDDAKNFFQTTLAELSELTGSQMAAVYLLSDDKKSFNFFESIGLDNRARQSFSADFPEGEFGLALSSKKIVHITNIPEDTLFLFPVVTGRFRPNEIITIPIMESERVVAVVSLASLTKFSALSLKILNEIWMMLTARINGVLAFKKSIEFMSKLDMQNKELEQQSREMTLQADELKEYNIELELQKKQLDESNQLKSAFLSNMSHELRTPLNSVIALSGVLSRKLDGKVPVQEYSYLEVIERNGKQLLALINDILDLSRIEAGREELEVTTFKIESLIEEVTETIRPQASQKNIGITCTSETETPAMSSDYEKCRHILQNLVANAVKFTEEGGVDIKVEQKNNSIVISVRDTGIGISQEHLPYIFDEFRQADGSSSRKYGGTGLGLAIATKYAQLLQGSIQVESVKGKGSTFTLTLPRVFSGAQSSSGAGSWERPGLKHQVNTKHESFNHAEKTILLVEDTEPIIIQMQDILTSQGYKILVARNGAEALKIIEKQIPDGMILDLMMPEVDGFEVLRRIRENEKTDKLPVIILTAKYVTKEELSFLKHNSVQQFIRKGDVNKAQLLEAVATMVSKKSHEVHLPKPVVVKAAPSGNNVVLIVEDNTDNLLTIKALLEGKCTILEAGDGLSAIEMAKIHQPQLILMDYALPGMNGIEALREVRKLQGLELVPIIAVSASAMKGDRENFILQGFDDYIPKPIDHVSFEKTILKWLITNAN
jgi:signal transduction histidine kinase/DNA-binding response OmpR family regulator/HAMP domain-containing protein